MLCNGTALSTSFVSANQLTAPVSAGLIANQGVVTVTVSANGAVSNGAGFTITAPANTTPTVSSLSPSSAQAGGAAFTLSVFGAGFTANSTVLWDGAFLSTKFVNISPMTASV